MYSFADLIRNFVQSLLVTLLIHPKDHYHIIVNVVFVVEWVAMQIWISLRRTAEDIRYFTNGNTRLMINEYVIA